MIEPWELQQYQWAAETTCRRLNLDPHAMIEMPSSTLPLHRPQWTVYAEKMHELRAMVEEMRHQGLSV